MEDLKLYKAVYIVECPNYETDVVQKAVERLVSLMGGWDKFVRPGEKILLKPNLLMKKSPEEAVTTHPAVAGAVARGIRGAGGHVVIGDSPGGPLNALLLQKHFAKWQLPERYEVIDAVPRTSTGKFWKLKLRERFPS